MAIFFHIVWIDNFSHSPGTVFFIGRIGRRNFSDEQYCFFLLIIAFLFSKGDASCLRTNGCSG